MTRNLFTIFMLALVLAATGCQSHQSTELPDSQLVLYSVPDDPTVSFRIVWKVGSENDPAGKEGLANLTAQLMTNGATTKQSYEQILDKLYPMATNYDVQVDKEVITFSGRVHKDNLDAFYTLFKQALLGPAFNAKDLERIRQEQLNYIEKTLRYADEEELGKAALYEFIFQGTPYQHLAAGYVSTLKTITVDDVRNFYKKYFTRDNLLIGLGGGFDPSFVQRVRADFGALPAGQVIKRPAVDPDPIDGYEVLIVEKPTRSTAISMGYPINVLRSDPDFQALWLADNWLGSHRNSSAHLYQVIREKRGLNYGDYSYIEYFPNGGRRSFPPPNVARHHQIFEIWLRPVEQVYGQFAARAAVRELNKLVNNGLTPEQFQLAQSFMGKYYLHYAPTTMARLGYRLDDVLYGMGGHFLADFPNRNNTLTNETTNQIISNDLQATNIKIVFVTQNADQLRQSLIADSPSPITYRTPKPDEVLKEDKDIAVFPLKVSPDKIHIVKAVDMFEKPLEQMLTAK